MNGDSGPGLSLPTGLGAGFGAGTGILGAIQTGGTNPLADLKAVSGIAGLGSSSGLFTMPAGTSTYLGGIGSIVGAAEQGGTNPVSDINAAAGATKIASAAGAISPGTAAELIPGLNLAAGAATIGMIDYSAIDPANIPDMEKYTLPGEVNTKLPSGNTVAEYGGIGVGAGSEESQGSGEIYLTNGYASTNPHWIGQADSGKLEQDEIQIEQAAAGPESQSLYDQTHGINAGGTSTVHPFGGSGISITSGPTSLIGGQANTSTPATQAQLNANAAAATRNMASIYNSIGGQAATGMSQAQWLSNMQAILGSFNDDGTYWGRT